MDSDSWNTRLSTFSRRYQSRSGVGSDLFFGGHDEVEGDDEYKAEFLCPFCAEDFDVVGLCCHIDEEHPVEAKNGVCPVCAKRVGMDLVGHLTMQHGNLLKVQRKRRLRRGGSNSTFSILRRELREGSLQSLLGGSFALSNSEPDPLLTSFIYNAPSIDETEPVQPPHSSIKSSSLKDSLTDDFLQRNVQASKLSDKDQEEKARRCEFVQGLLWSAIVDDSL